jgi:trimethylamine--corrinoid protein Co-methyltransferase
MRFYNILSTHELERIHQQALEILGQVGCIIEHQEALTCLHDTGAKVDFDKNRAFFSESMVTEALVSVTRKYLAAGRNPDDGYEVFAGMDTKLRCLGGALNWLSTVTGESHPITRAHASKMLTLADALPQIDLVGTPFAAEFPSRSYDVHSLRLALNSTTKHIWALTLNSKNLRYQMELLEAVSGGKDKLKTHKRISGIVCINDPFRFSYDEIERLRIYGTHTVPVKWTSSSMIGGNAPYTVAGALAQNIAQFLAGLVITQTIAPGTPVVYYTTLQIMDMHTGFAIFNSPELMLAEAVIAQLARHYNLPSAISSLNSTGTEKEQALFLRGVGLMNCMLSGACEINLGGSMDGGASFSPEFAVIDDEFMAYLRSLSKGFVIDNDSMSLEAISRGIETGQYVSDPHTLKYLREEIHFESDLFDWSSYEVGSQRHVRSLLEKAGEIADHLMVNHQIPPLEDKLAQELDAIVAAADKDLLI